MSDDGRLVLVFDDGYAEDRELVAPVLASAGVPAVVAIVPDRLGADGYMTAREVRALSERGWEVAAHGRRHRYLQAHRLARDAMPGDDRLSLDGGHVFPGDDGGVGAGDRYDVVDDDGHETVEVADAGESGDAEYVDLAAPLERGFAAGETVVRPAEATLRDEVVGAREALGELGVDPDTFVFPYDAASVRAWRLAGAEYDVVANAAVRSLPNPPGTAPTNLRRWYLETDHLRPPEVGDYLDAVAEQGGVGVLAGHSAWDTVTAERVERVVEAAHERDVEVTTFRGLAD